MVVLAQNYRQMLADSMLSWTVSLVFFVLGLWFLLWADLHRRHSIKNIQ